MLKWNEYEVIECLEVEPQIEQNGLFHVFQVNKDGLKLKLTIFQYDGDIRIEVYRDGIGLPIFTTAILSSSGIRYEHYKKDNEHIEYLEIGAPRRYNSVYEEDWLIPMGVRIRVNPSINIELFTP